MTIADRIKSAEASRDEAFRNNSNSGIACWDGYIDALKAVKETSRAAEEIFAELKTAGINELRYPIIAELKKKYAEEEG